MSLYLEMPAAEQVRPSPTLILIFSILGMKVIYF